MTAALSTLALVVATAALFNQWRQGRGQARMQSRLALLEEDRRQDELEPRFEVQFDRRPTSQVTLTNLGPRNYDAVKCQMIAHPKAPNLAGFSVDAQTVTEVDLGPLARGEAAVLRLVDDGLLVGGRLRLKLSCRSGAQSVPTTTVCEVKVYGPARVTSFAGHQLPGLSPRRLP